MIKNKNKKEIREVVWKDRIIIDTIFIIISVIAILFGFFLLFYFSKEYLEKLEAMVIIIIGIFTTYFQLIRKRTIVSSLGVFVGNVTAKKWNSLKLRSRQFISWKIISSIKLVNHEVRGSRGSWIRTFVVIKTNSNKKYECVVYDMEGFITALKKLNKYNLVGKDSRYK